MRGMMKKEMIATERVKVIKSYPIATTRGDNSYENPNQPNRPS
jgi:hypothetical protein